MRALLLLLGAALCASAQDVWNACSTDQQCWPMNGVCMDARSNGEPGRCACAYGYVFDETHQRCDWPGYGEVPRVNMSLGARLYYAEHQTSNSTWRGDATLPSDWVCNSASGHCTATSELVEFSGFVYSTLLTLNASLCRVLYAYGYDYNLSMALTGLDWRCKNTRQFYKLNDLSAVGPSVQGDVMRAVEEHCLTCAEWCGVRGTCLNETDYSCTCSGGWSGERCAIPPANATSYRFDLDGVVPNCTFDSDCDGNQTCWHGGACGCAVGYTPQPDLASLTLAVSMAIDAGNITEALQLQVNTTCQSSNTSIYYGAPLSNSPWTSYDIHVYDIDTAAYWYEDNYTTHVVLGDRPVASNDFQFRINVSAADAHYWACKNPLAFFWAGDDVPLEDAWRHCTGCRSVCGPWADCDQSNATTGECVCTNANVVGDRCDACASGWAGPGCTLNATLCSVANCSEHGQCNLSTSGECVCDARYSGANCSVYAAPTCGTGGTGYTQPDGTCACANASLFGVNCEFSAEVCAWARCSGNGTCASQTQTCACRTGFALHNCSQMACYNGGIWQSNNTCVCPASTVGSTCRWWRCGPTRAAGTYVSANGSCLCQGLYSADPLTGNCTVHTCGTWGAPSQTNPSVCTCSPPHQDLGAGVCVLDCGASGTYNATSDQCDCASGAYGNYCEYGYSLAAVVAVESESETNATAPVVVRGSLNEGEEAGLAIAGAVVVLSTFAMLWITWRAGHRAFVRKRIEDAEREGRLPRGMNTHR